MKAIRWGRFFWLFNLLMLNPCNALLAQTTGAPPERRWVNPQPDIPFLPKPATRPADWIVRHDPVVPDTSPQAEALLSFLYDISGRHTLSGQHNFAAEQGYSTKVFERATHKTPVIYGTDWGFAAKGDKDSAFVRQATVETLIDQYRKGSIIAICWHEVRPTQDEPVTFRQSVQGKLTDEQFRDVITPGTPLYNRWCAQVDVVAAYLKQLQNAGVPVLFRPYHEMNGDWFWWGARRGPEGTAQLYRQIFDRLVHHHHLTNLIWVWNVDQPAREDRQFVDYFPGQQYVDVLALDDYGVFQQRFYDELNALSDGKVLAIAETFNPPAAKIYATQPRWAYWMRWAVNRPRASSGPSSRPAGFGDFGGAPRNRPAIPLADIVKDPRVFSLDDPAYWNAVAALRIASNLPDAPAAVKPD